jgi:RNA polymerase sigma-70 factor (ECF subfamily)
MASLKTGNQEALAELFRRYSRLVLSIALRILRDAGEAEETTQDIFLFLFERAANFDRSKGDAKAWIVQVAYHRSLDRQDYLHRRDFYSGTDFEIHADTLAGPHDVEREVASRQDRERLKQAFESLSDKQRRTLELFFFEELDFKEIAERLGESLENVRHYYYRAIQKLRKDGLIAKLKDNKKP